MSNFVIDKDVECWQGMKFGGEKKSKVGKCRGVQKAPKPKWNLCGRGMGSCGATPSALMEETGKDARLVGSGEGIP